MSIAWIALLLVGSTNSHRIDGEDAMSAARAILSKADVHGPLHLKQLYSEYDRWTKKDEWVVAFDSPTGATWVEIDAATNLPTRIETPTDPATTTNPDIPPTPESLQRLKSTLKGLGYQDDCEGRVRC